MGDIETARATARPSKPLPPGGRERWPKPRAMLRALHRDIGYLLVGLTVVYALSGLAINHVGDGDGATPVVERRLAGVYSHDFGDPLADAPLLLAKACDGGPQPGALCLREAPDRWRNIPPPPDPAGLLGRVPFLVHVAASSAGEAYAFGWLDGGGDLVIVDHRSETVRQIAKGSVPSWAGSGVDWSSLSIEAGTLRFLLSNIGAGFSSAGIVEIRPDDTIVAEPLEGRLSAAGPRALLLTPAGEIRETVDAGHSFHDVESPPGGVRSDVFLRCVETGCEVGPWYRPGWGRTKRPSSR